MVDDAAELERELARLIADADLRERMGVAARELVRRQQGATARTLDVIDALSLQTAAGEPRESGKMPECTASRRFSRSGHSRRPSAASD